MEIVTTHWVSTAQCSYAKTAVCLKRHKLYSNWHVFIHYGTCHWRHLQIMATSIFEHIDLSSDMISSNFCDRKVQAAVVDSFRCSSVNSWDELHFKFQANLRFGRRTQNTRKKTWNIHTSIVSVELRLKAHLSLTNNFYKNIIHLFIDLIFLKFHDVMVYLFSIFRFLIASSVVKNMNIPYKIPWLL